MTKIVIILLSYTIILFSSILIANERDEKLRIGLLAPFSGEYKNLGESLLLSTQLALDEIDNENIVIVPRDSGSNNKIKLNTAIEEIINNQVKIIIGPVSFSSLPELKKYNDTVFISLSNKDPKISKNVINIGISLESQLNAIEKFLIENKRSKTLILYPKNVYEKFVDEKIKSLKLKKIKIFKYNSDPRILTGEIEKLTNYKQRQKNLERRKKILKKLDTERARKELKILDSLYTLGAVNFDSIIIIDFGSSLKSVLASLVYSDVDDKTVLFTTINQWFDESIFRGNSVKNLYFPSVDLKQFKKYNEKYFNTFGLKPDEITILAYDALGLINYVWKKNNNVKNINDFFIKEEIKGKIGTFKFKDNKVLQKLKIYKIEKNKFKEY
ncbi:ABC transporter substrate-binding protein [Pelagibacteraceae bacterium]|jgi:ABC-type branched-subunit amino acid transport system substrate-binding protein|nr:ABC transporter substrate-binding protein [Pelagibacteraceae bacterium]